MQVLLNEDEVSEEFQNSLLLRPADEREVNRIKPNPSLKVQQPVFVDPGPSKRSAKGKSTNKGLSTGLCLEISGRVQNEACDLKHFVIEDQVEVA